MYIHLHIENNEVFDLKNRKMNNLELCQQGFFDNSTEERTMPKAFTATTSEGFAVATVCKTVSGWFENNHLSEHSTMEEAEKFAAEFNAKHNV